MSGNKRSSRLYVGSVGNQTTQRDIEDLFGKFGAITEVRLTRNFAFVQYTNEESAEDALKELNGKLHFGKNLDVQFARAQRASAGGDKKDDNNQRDRSPIGGGNRGPGGPGGRGGPPGGRGGHGGGPPFGENRGPFGGNNRGGNFNERDLPSLFGRDGPRDGGPNDMIDRPPNDRFGGGRDFDRGGPQGGRGDFRGDGWGGPGGRGDRGMERDRPDPWGNGPGGRGPPPRDGPDFREREPDYRDGPDFRDGPPPFRGGGPDRGMDFRDREFGPRGMDRGPDGPPGGRGDWDRGDFGRERGPFGRDGGDDRFGGGRPGGFRDDPGFRGDRDFGRDGGPPPVWAQQEKPPNSDPIPLNTSNADRTNDIEIIVMNKSITDYGEYIESRLKSIGFTVDIMFPNENAPMPRVLGNIASRGTLYAIIINPAHKLNRSLTLQVLHGTPQEHRNMLIEDAIIFLNRNFENYSKSQSEKRGPNAPPEQVRHLLELVISAARPLTITQFDILIQYFINEKMKAEPSAAADSLPVNQQAELQTRILSILNKNSGGGAGGPPGGGLLNLPGLLPQASKEGQSPLLKDPSVQRALDSLIQGSSNLFNAFGGKNRM